MATELQEVINRLDRITALLLSVQPNAVPGPPPYERVPAYHRPSLTVDQVQHFDGKTFNSDGSLWTMQEVGNVFSPVPNVGAVPGAKVPVCIAYGYISPVKTPEIWRVGPKWSGNWDGVDADWRRNPYRIYKADIPAWIKTNGEDNNNFILLSYLMNPFTSFVQE